MKIMLSPQPDGSLERLQLLHASAQVHERMASFYLAIDNLKKRKGSADLGLDVASLIKQAEELTAALEVAEEALARKASDSARETFRAIAEQLDALAERAHKLDQLNQVEGRDRIESYGKAVIEPERAKEELHVATVNAVKEVPLAPCSEDAKNSPKEMGRADSSSGSVVGAAVFLLIIFNAFVGAVAWWNENLEGFYFVAGLSLMAAVCWCVFDKMKRHLSVDSDYALRRLPLIYLLGRIWAPCLLGFLALALIWTVDDNLSRRTLRNHQEQNHQDLYDNAGNRIHFAGSNVRHVPESQRNVEVFFGLLVYFCFYLLIMYYLTCYCVEVWNNFVNLQRAKTLALNGQRPEAVEIWLKIAGKLKERHPLKYVLTKLINDRGVA